MKLFGWLFFILIAATVPVSSCNTINEKKFQFFYYPQFNVYFDVANSKYFFSLDSGKTWDSVYARTNAEPATLGTKQILYSDTHAIWNSNQQHLKQYNGHAINIVYSDTVAVKEDRVADRKIKKIKSVTADNTKQQQEKKPGFFQRLFGKKHS
jgi:hypothetical protein